MMAKEAPPETGQTLVKNGPKPEGASFAMVAKSKISRIEGVDRF